MALLTIATNCCLNPSYPTLGLGPLAPALRHPTKTTQKLSWPRNEGPLRSGFVLSTACLIIGLQMGPLSEGRCAFAEDLQSITAVEKKAMKWSERRLCPPWRVKSWEIIVPENLPRPSVDVESDDVARSASMMKINPRRAGNNCFSM